jgi:histidine ammonia-lyase
VIYSNQKTMLQGMHYGVPRRYGKGGFTMKVELKNPAKMENVVLTDCMIGLDEFMAVVRFGAKVEFSQLFCENIRRNRALIDRFLHEERAIYGVTTGFGENVRYTISSKDAQELQRNIVRSHASAVGEPLTKEQARAVMFMTILNAGQAHSGIRLETLEMIREFLNRDITPYAPGEGSVGYLGVEAHLVLAYIGEGYILEGNEKIPALKVLEEHGLKPIVLECKEGLSMLNGTITVTALGLLASYDSLLVMKNVEIAGALCYEALHGTTKALDPRIHNNKKHEEQQASAANLLRMLDGSEICEKYVDDKVQDAYIMRCMPHVHGASYRLVKEAYTAIVEEMHSVSDNPEIFDTEDGAGVALMSGNFDGTYVGSHADMIGMACAIVGNQVERSIDRMVNHNLNDGLPAFLVTNPGLHNGFMIPQYTAAGLQNEIKLLAIPASIDSIPTCAGQEDPVSMAYNASKRAGEAVRKLQYMVAIEIMVALQAIDLRKPLTQGKATAKIHDFVRETVAFADKDRFFQPDIEYIKGLVKDGVLVQLMEEEIGEIRL